MLESPTLDRFLRKAQDFLARDDFAGAIKVLQDVVEGHVHARVEPGEAAAKPAGGESSPAESSSGETGEDDPRHAVFSSDGRLFRPVLRLCQEMMASMAQQGRDLYRQMYEVAAERSYRDAMAARDLRRLESTYNRYIVTYNGIRAMYAAGDMLMLRGRLRAAVQTLRKLQALYPEEQRAKVAGLSDLYIGVKIALCLGQLGEREQAVEVLRQLEATHPGATVRIMGELVPVASLKDGPLPGAADRGGHATAVEAPIVMRTLDAGLIPIWQHLFADPEPYRRPTTGNENRRIVAFGNGMALPAAPRYSDDRPGSTVTFDGDLVAVMDNYRLMVHQLESGLLRLHTDGSLEPPQPRRGSARSRVPVYDYSTLRVGDDGERYYCVLGPSGRSAGADLDAILRNHLVAYDRSSGRSLWTTQDDRGFSGVTFLATPTVFGHRLLVPVLDKGAYSLQAIDAATGAGEFRVHLHTGGTELARAPAVPVVVQNGTAYVLTNAGTVASVDAYSGDLHWIRRYERTHPLRPSRRMRSRLSNRTLGRQQVFREIGLPGFVPSDLTVVDGRLLVAPCDGDALLCLDGASGELLWVLPMPEDTGVYVLGHNSKYLYLAGNTSVTCIDHRSGLRLWRADTPDSKWVGRGLVTEELIALPGDYCIHVLPADGQGPWREYDLPEFSVGREPLSGAANLQAHGPYLVVCYEGGVEVFASLDALRELAQATGDPEKRAGLLIQTGDLQAAIELLGPLTTDTARSQEDRSRIGRRLQSLVRDVVLALASHGARDQALALLKRASAWTTDRALRLRLQQLRIDVFRTLGEPAAVEREQDVLYGIMEGRR